MRVPAGFEEPIALAQGYVQRLRKRDERRTAWQCDSRLDDAHVPTGASPRQREIDLAHAASGPPFSKELADRMTVMTYNLRCDCLHWSLALFTGFTRSRIQEDLWSASPCA